MDETEIDRNGGDYGIIALFPGSVTGGLQLSPITLSERFVIVWAIAKMNAGW